MKKLSESSNKIIPDSFSALEAAQYALGRAKKSAGLSLIDGMTFSDLANLARSLDIVSTNEREQLDCVNSRRNDAAHFRAVGYDDAFELEEIVRSLLPKINSRSTKNEE